jgi:tRNA(Arg) A34 adenosine deaminase TadA
MNVELPSWLHEMSVPTHVDDDVTAMCVALDLATMNVDRGTGGPFGAVIVDDRTRAVVGLGVNLVTSIGCSVLHAEIVAIMQASERASTWDLRSTGELTLVTTAEPCAMCMGAVPWSGVRRLVIGARDEDVRAIGFDEGAKRSQWMEDLRLRGIHVVRDVLREEAKHLLARYVTRGGPIYDPAITNRSTS